MVEDRFWPIVRTIQDTKELKSRKSRCGIPVHIYTANSKGDYHFIGLIELSKYLTDITFARTRGAKDKKPRKRRNLIAEGSAVGAVGLAAANPMLKRQQGLLNTEKKFLNEKNEMYKSHKRWIDRSRNDEFFTKQKGLLDREDKAVERINKRLQPRLKQNARELSLVKAGKKVAKYGAIGLAGVAGAELARRGIKKARQYKIRRK